jgi:hypothetical protein
VPFSVAGHAAQSNCTLPADLEVPQPRVDPSRQEQGN